MFQDLTHEQHSAKFSVYEGNIMIIQAHNPRHHNNGIVCMWQLFCGFSVLCHNLWFLL